MYSKLINSKIIQTEEQTPNTFNNMESKFNHLIDIDEFKRKQKKETEDEFNYRITIYNFIIERIKLNGDIAITLTLMLINRMKYGVKYNIKYERILDKIQNELGK
jgi:hypothetical protein